MWVMAVPDVRIRNIAILRWGLACREEYAAHGPFLDIYRQVAEYSKVVIARTELRMSKGREIERFRPPDIVALTERLALGDPYGVSL